MNFKEYEDHINHGNSFLFDKGFTHEQLEIIKNEMMYAYHLRK